MNSDTRNMQAETLASPEDSSLPDDKVSILVVDDLPEKILAYETILEELGQNLVTVRSGEEALKMVLKQEFAVILLDVNMPGMDGFETASLIRKRRKSAHTPIIFLTAFTDEIRMAQGYASGAVDYLPTPVVPEVLKAKVRVFIELSQMRRQAALQAEERVKRTAAEESARRSQFLFRVGEVLDTSSSCREMLRALVQLPVPELADTAILCVEDQETHERIIKCGWNAGGLTHVRPMPDKHPLLPWVEEMIEQVSAHKGHQVFKLPNTPQDQMTPDAVVEPSLPTLCVALALPIQLQCTSDGVLILARSSKSGDYTASEISLANDFASRASTAIENILLLERIRTADHRKDEFLAMLAHELRNPLAPIRNALHVMKQGTRTDLREEAQDTIERQLQHMIHLVDDLMDVSRITQGKIELRRSHMLLEEALRHAIETARPLIDQLSHRLHVNLCDTPVWLNADPARISQIFSNLLNNAAKYTNAQGDISLQSSIIGNKVEIRVRDNGIGIPKQMQHRIFDLFSQVDSSLERAQGGLGIGLTLVKSLVEMHDGTITVKSNDGQPGSEFIVTFPLAVAPEQTASPEPSTIAASGQPLRVLIVDDNEASAKTLGWMIEMTGHHTLLSHDGKHAIETAKTYLPDVVLLDIGLPGMNGYEVCRELRNLPPLSRTTFIAQTGWGQAEHRQRSKEAGFDHHLVKPVDITLLQNLLAELASPPKKALSA